MSSARTIRQASVSASSRPEWDPNLPAALRDAVNNYPLVETPDWEKLAELSDQTVLKGIEVFAAHSVYDDGGFVAPANIDVVLQYDPQLPTKNSFEDAYPARIFFNIIEDGASSDEHVYPESQRIRKKFLRTGGVWIRLWG